MIFEPGTYNTQELIDLGLLHIGDGYRAKNSELSVDGIPFARAGNINDGFRFDGADHFPMKDLPKVGDKRSMPFDSVFTSKGTVGRIAYVKENTQEFVYSPQLCYWRCLNYNAIDPRFLNYWMNGAEFKNQIDYLKGQTDMADYVSLRDQRKMKITIPQIDIQRKISKILSSFDDKIELNRQINQTLEEMAQAIFKSWFVDFEPVKAKIEAKVDGQDPERAAMCAISGKTDTELDHLPPDQLAQLRTTAALFPDELIESELGLIPERWKLESIYTICDVIYGAPFKSKLFNSEKDGLPLIRIRDLKNETPGVYTAETHPKGYLVTPGDLLVGMDGEFRPYLWGGENAWINQRVCCFKAKEKYSTAFLQFTISPQLAHIEATETATTVIHLGKGDIDRFHCILPSEELIVIFNELVNGLFKAIVAFKKESTSLRQLRDTLLPKLLSGEISVNNDESTIQEAV